MDTPPGAKRWFFDAWSRLYDLPVVQWLTYRPVHDAVLHVLREDRPRTVLDLGCGTGLLSQRIRRELPRVWVVGCDFSLGMLRRALGHGGRPWSREMPCACPSVTRASTRSSPPRRSTGFPTSRLPWPSASVCWLPVAACSSRW